MSKPSYPQFTGHEPCATVGHEVFYDDARLAEKDTMKTLTEMCQTRCFMYEECLEWAVRCERYGFWAGTLPSHRQRMRQYRGLVVNDPADAVVPRSHWKRADGTAA